MVSMRAGLSFNPSSSSLSSSLWPTLSIVSVLLRSRRVRVIILVAPLIAFCLLVLYDLHQPKAPPDHHHRHLLRRRQRLVADSHSLRTLTHARQHGISAVNAGLGDESKMKIMKRTRSSRLGARLRSRFNSTSSIKSGYNTGRKASDAHGSTSSNSNDNRDVSTINKNNYDTSTNDRTISNRNNDSPKQHSRTPTIKSANTHHEHTVDQALPPQSQSQSHSARVQSTDSTTRSSPLQTQDEIMPDGSLSQASACRRLLSNPVAYDPTSCSKRNATSHQCVSGTASMMSQYRQDYYLYMTHFQHLQRRGVYVDAAAHDPVRISNTWFFDACLQWRGLCVEGNPAYASLLSHRRSCAVVPTCAGDVAGERVRFALADGLGGVEKTNKNSHKIFHAHGEMRHVYNGSLTLTCTTLRDELRKFERFDVVDYLSLDVEGHELAVLKGVDWERTRINVITVESNVGGDLEDFLLRKGYVKRDVKRGKRTDVPTMLQDDLFVRSDVVWGKPL